LQAFQDRILNHLLPEFCNDPSRSWTADGFKADWQKICDVDAHDFLRGMDAELIKHRGRGLYRAPRSNASEQFFWSGLRRKNPRPIFLWAEPIITVAVLARLHFDLGWPKELIGTQTKKVWAFDVATYSSRESEAECIVCEVKKSTAELDQLVNLMNRFAKDPHAHHTERKEQNAWRKLEALRSNRPPLLWAVGPGGSSYAFRMRYQEDGVVNFQKIDIQELCYPSGLKL
jgi:hypothetical protein